MARKRKDAARVKRYEVSVTSKVEVYSTITVEAADEAEATKIVQKMIEENLFDIGYEPHEKAAEAGIEFGDIDQDVTIDDVDLVD